MLRTHLSFSNWELSGSIFQGIALNDRAPNIARRNMVMDVKVPIWMDCHVSRLHLQTNIFSFFLGNLRRYQVIETQWIAFDFKVD